MAINAEHSRAYAVLVARRVAKCISSYSAIVGTGFAIRIAPVIKPDSTLPENALRKNNNAGTKARVIGIQSAKRSISATRADRRRNRRGRRPDRRAHRRDRRQTPASASSAAGLRAAAS